MAGIPGLDGAPGELAGMTVLVGEGHLADGLDAGLDRVARGHVDGAQDPHFEIGGGMTHEFCFRFVGAGVRAGVFLFAP